jgi:hypothetical protein
MCGVIAVVLSDEADGLRDAVEAKLRGLPRGTWLWEQGVGGNGHGVVLITDDPSHPRLGWMLQCARSRFDAGRILVIGWGCGLEWAQAMRAAVGAVCLLPDQPELARLEVLRLADPYVGTHPLGLRFVRALPDSLELALRRVLGRSGSPAGPPPPRNASSLSRACGIDRSNLAFQARRHGVDLGLVCGLAFLRWLRLQLVGEDRGTPAELAKRAGFETVRGLRSWVRRVTGRPLGRLDTLAPGAVEARLRAAVSGVTAPNP